MSKASAVPMVIVELNAEEWQLSQTETGWRLLGSLKSANLMCEQLSGVFYSGKDASRDVARVKRVVSTKFNLTMRQMLGKSRRRNIVWPRQLAMWLCRKLADDRGLKLGLRDVADHFKRPDGSVPDHGTILHAMNAVESEIKKPSQFQQVQELKQAILEDEKWTQTSES